MKRTLAVGLLAVLVVGVAGPVAPASARRPNPALETVGYDSPATAGPTSGPGARPTPANSGTGKRIVYSVPQQRVWLVEADERLNRTYLVSGRLSFPRTGTYHIFSRSRHTTSGAVRMEYMLRFAHGQRLSAGFHSIPVGRRGPIQSESQLGTPLSHGCVRQKVSDAAYLWDWAPNGTTVVVMR